MKKFSLITTLIAPLILLSGCEKEKVTDEADAVKIQFSAEDTSSRAAIGSEGFPTGSAFSVWGYMTKESQTATVTVFEGSTVTKEADDNWNCSDIRYWFPGWTYNFYGVYPANLPENSVATVTNDGTITVTDFNCSATGNAAIDLMTATSEPNLSGDNPPESVNLNFKHELARVKFIIASEGDAVKITNAQLYGISHIGSFTSNTSTGITWTLGPISNVNTPSFKTENLDITDTQDHELFGGDLLLPPHSKLDGAMLTFQYQYEGDTESHTANIQLNQDSNINTWQSNQRYNYRINIPLNSVDVSLTVTVTDWEEKNLTVEW